MQSVPMTGICVQVCSCSAHARLLACAWCTLIGLYRVSCVKTNHATVALKYKGKLAIITNQLCSQDTDLLNKKHILKHILQYPFWVYRCLIKI